MSMVKQLLVALHCSRTEQLMEQTEHLPTCEEHSVTGCPGVSAC